MNRLKKILCFVIPFVFLSALVFRTTLPTTLKKEDPAQVLSLERAFADETGASTADRSEKGGAIYLEENSVYLMKGGTISGSENTFGGAVYVSNGATFTMEGGTITGCSARYGGAIYVERGGTCLISGGKILNNTAEVAPAIYVEDGGRLLIVDDPTIENNTVGLYLRMGPETTLGNIDSGIKLKTLYLGTYPQSYVGNSMNETLESWMDHSNPVGSYHIYSRTFNQDMRVQETPINTYLYTDGNYYARMCAICKYNSCFSDKDKTSIVTGNYYWFKVEPILWYILNYDEWANNEADLEIFSTQVLSGEVESSSFFPDPDEWSDENNNFRNWCQFFCDEAFSINEKGILKTSTIGNNAPGYFDDASGTPTQDIVYLKSYEEINSGVFTNNQSRICHATDFALANNAYFWESDGVITPFGAGHTLYFLRTFGGTSGCNVRSDGVAYTYVNSNGISLRPALRLNI